MIWLKSNKKVRKHKTLKISKRFALVPTELSNGWYAWLESYYVIKSWSPVFRIKFAGESDGQHYWRLRRKSLSIFGFRRF